MSDHILNRFFSKIKYGPGDCWYWLGYLDKGGYGLFMLKPEVKIGAHVFSYEYHKKVEAKYDIHHICEHPNCVNPDHLEDLKRSKHRFIHEAGSLCKNGHSRALYDGRNSKGRYCKKCASIAKKKCVTKITWIKNV